MLHQHNKRAIRKRKKKIEDLWRSLESTAQDMHQWRKIKRKTDWTKRDKEEKASEIFHNYLTLSRQTSLQEMVQHLWGVCVSLPAVFFAARVHSRRTLAIIIISDDLTSLSRTVGTRTKKKWSLNWYLTRKPNKSERTRKTCKSNFEYGCVVFFPFPGRNKNVNKVGREECGEATI